MKDKILESSFNVDLLCKKITNLLDQYKAEDIKIISLKDKSDIADYLVVCTGTSKTHVKALANYLTEKLKKDDLPFLSVEGHRSGDWVLVDAGDIITHLFRSEVRSFYNLEKIWDSPLIKN